MSRQNKSSYESVLAVVLLLLLIHYFFPQPYFIPAIIGLILLTLLFNTLANTLHRAWEQLTLGVGWVMSRLFLSIVFFVFLTPLAFLYRLFRKEKAIRPTSNFVDRNHVYQADDLANPW